jgi:probable HAF family extracellular repeat protein
MQDLGTLPGGSHSESASINNSGWIVGSSDSSLGLRAFLWTPGGGMQDLNRLIPQNSNLVLAGATSINDAGQIVAFGSDKHDLSHDRETQLDDALHAGPTHVFLLTPVR